jgi:FixJ family two-component response regulator
MISMAENSHASRPNAPSLLVVDDEADLIDLVGDLVERNIECRLITAGTIAEAKKILQSQTVDLLVSDLRLPDGNGADLLQLLAKHQPLASAIVMTGAPSVDGAIAALRRGAIDFLPKPFSSADFLQRVRSALHNHAARLKSESRIERLREAVRRLNDSRRMVSKKVDLLCNDLVTAYGELSKQLDLVRTTESFRGAINSAKDLEQMLCHAMDWTLRQMGYSNVAIWLAADPGFQLGAYMKFTIAGEQELIEAMREGLLPIVVRDGITHLEGDAIAKKLSVEEMKFLHDQTILAAHCTYLGESLATVVMFRDKAKPFDEAAVATLTAIAPVFAVTLATMVRSEEDEEDGADEESSEGGGLLDHDSIEGNEDRPPRKRRKRDEADWWKNGEESPY